MKLNSIYKCLECGNIVMLSHAGGGTFVCCNKEMTLLTENSVEASKEKHIPIIEKTDKGIKIKVGSIEHPMEEKHYIEWIEIVTPEKIYRKYLKSGEKPEAEFCIKADKFTIREYCSLHGLWKNDI